MPANRFNGFTDYGIGIGLRVPHYQHILTRKPVVDWFEIISENFMVDGGRPLHILDQILEQYRVVQHGVSMYFGSAERPTASTSAASRIWSSAPRRPGFPIISAGAASTAATPTTCCPCPTLSRPRKLTAQKVREARDFLEVPIAVENVSSYAEFHVSEMTEWEFLTEVVERADCGILLDVNKSTSPRRITISIPSPTSTASRPSASRRSTSPAIPNTKNTFSTPTIIRCIDPVWKLYARAVERVGHTATLLEWDDSIPSFDEVHHEALKAKNSSPALRSGHAPYEACSSAFNARWPPRSCLRSPPSERMRRARARRPLPCPVVAEFIKPNDRLTSFERLEIYNRQYWYRIFSCFAEDFPGLRAVLGDRKFERLARAYLARYPSESFCLRNLGSPWLRAQTKIRRPAPSTGARYGATRMGRNQCLRRRGEAPLHADDLLRPIRPRCVSPCSRTSLSWKSAIPWTICSSRSAKMRTTSASPATP